MTSEGDQNSAGVSRSDDGCLEELDAKWMSSIRRRLITWYRRGHRDLPWRQDRNPYHVLVAEVMLVQTTVAIVIPYFHRFLSQFPSVEDLAGATEADVLKAWEGLGYYRRAKQLHAAARVIVSEHSGIVPSSDRELLALPGVGRYIAGAVRSFAFDQAAPIIETNTKRVLARWLAWRGVLNEAFSLSHLWDSASRFVPRKGSGEFNQAFIELGATVCVPKSPRCHVCPVNGLCRARTLGLQETLPVVAKRVGRAKVFEACGIVEQSDRVLIVQRGRGGLWDDFWEFPTVHLSGPDPARRGTGGRENLVDGVRRLTGIQIESGPVVRTVRYSVTSYSVELNSHSAVAVGGDPRPGLGLVQVRWVAPHHLANYSISAAYRRLADWYYSA